MSFEPLEYLAEHLIDHEAMKVINIAKLSKMITRTGNVVKIGDIDSDNYIEIDGDNNKTSFYHNNVKVAELTVDGDFKIKGEFSEGQIF